MTQNSSQIQGKFYPLQHEKLHATCGMEFLGMGNRAWGRQCGLGVSPSGATAVMGKKFPMPNALCPRSAGRLSPYRHLGMEFPAAFNEEWLYACRELTQAQRDVLDDRIHLFGRSDLAKLALAQATCLEFRITVTFEEVEP